MASTLHFAKASTLSTAAGLLLLALAAGQAHGQSEAQRKSVPATAPTAAPAAPSTATAPGSRIDQVVAIVNSDIILDSDVDQELRFEALQPFHAEAPNTRSQMLERLINRDLILQQAALQPGNLVSDADVNKEIVALRKNSPACKQEDCATQEGWDRFLGSHGFTDATFTERWRQRMEVLRFIEQRFRMGTRITPAEIKDYYTKTMLPAYAKQHATPPSLDVVSDRVEEVLLEQRVSSLLDDWLKSLHAQGSVFVLHPGEEAP